MKHSIQTDKGRQLMIFGFLVLGVLLIGNHSPLAVQKGKQAGWRVEIEEGKTARSTLTINNRCKALHQFRIENKIKYLRFEQSTQAIPIGPASTAQLGVVFNATGLKLGIHRDKLAVICADCKKEKGCAQDRDEIPVEVTLVKPTHPQEELAFRPIKVLFKWHGLDPKGHGCNTPLGICFILGFSLADSALTRAEVANGFGISDWRVEGERLHMIFHQPAALSDGTIRIDYDKQLEPEVARALGHDLITFKRGIYRVDMSKERFGETFVDIVKGKPALDGSVQAAVACYRYSNTTGLGKGCGVACDDGTNYPMDCKADIFKNSRYVTYDPKFYGPGRVLKARFTISDSPVSRKQELGIVETFDSLGTENSCSALPGKGAQPGINFAVIIPEINKPLKN